MKQIPILFYYEWLHFKAEKSLLLFSALLLLCGFYGIYSGTAEISRQRDKLAQLDGIYQDNISEMKTKYPGDADAGDIGYYHSAFSKNNPDNWAALSVGQRDANPSYLKIRLLAVQNQLYSSENTNPDKLATGSFDLSFVFVFLMPLFIIATGFNIFSAEKEQGTLSIMLSQPLSLFSLLFSKLLFRFTLVLVLIFILSIAGWLWSNAVADLRGLAWLAAIILYSIFWFGVVLCMVLLKKSSAFNAVSLLGIWLLLTIILPVLINVTAEISKPVSEGLALSLKQREEVHAGWDRPKEETMKRFFKTYPQYSNTSSVGGKFKWKWYFAFQELGDQSVEKLYHQYNARLSDRQHFASTFSVISAPAMLQEVLNGIAGTELKQQLEFVARTKAYHNRLKEFYYPFLYNEKPFTHADFSKEPQHVFTAGSDWQRVSSGLLTLFFSTVVIVLLTLIISSNNKLIND